MPDVLSQGRTLQSSNFESHEDLIRACGKSTYLYDIHNLISTIYLYMTLYFTPLIIQVGLWLNAGSICTSSDDFDT